MDVLIFKGDLSLITAFQKLPTLNEPKNYPIFNLLSIFLISFGSFNYLDEGQTPPNS